MSERTQANLAQDESIGLSAAENIAGTEPAGMPSVTSMARSAVGLLAQGTALRESAVRFGAETVRVVRGDSGLELSRDARFKDPAWSNPVLRRLGQEYLALTREIDALVEHRERDGEAAEQTRFVANILASAISPTNFLATNPAALKQAFHTKGFSLVRGGRNFVRDLRTNGGMPSMAKPDVLEVGVDMALTPGSVIDRDEVAELLEFHPTTDTVRELPLLIVPPPIGRYYFLDLAPGRSFVEYAVSRGLRTHILSWRNPTPEERDWDVDTYTQRILHAVDTILATTGAPAVNLVGFCAGGMLTTAVLNHLAKHGREDKIATMTFAVTLLDFGLPAPIGAFSAPKLLALARYNSRRAGIISARSMGSVFAWMRPNDLVWNYWVNNYLLGQDPPVFDILSWNADGTNLPAALHLQFLDCYQNNVLANGDLVALGDKVDLATIRVPTFVTGAINDHLTPWRGTYRTTQLLSGPSTFVLSHSGHIQSLVNPPGNPKSSFYIGDDPGPDPDQWLASATQHPGTWWTVWADWEIQQSGAEVPAPARPGNRKHRPLTAAPGLYVRDLTPADETPHSDPPSGRANGKR
jgi:polyhydroxyalkanoate synthase subunit PhaC